jgi:hypothetical protein
MAMRRRRSLPPASLITSFALLCFSFAASAGNRIWIPVRWCGVEGAPSMDNPGTVNEATTDDVLWRRHERPTDAIYIPFADMSFRAGATADIKNGPQSFPIIRDPSGSGGNIEESTGEATDSITMCRRAWTMGDALYFEQSNNSVVNAGTDTLLSTSVATVGVEIFTEAVPVCRRGLMYATISAARATAHPRCTSPWQWLFSCGRALPSPATHQFQLNSNLRHDRHPQRHSPFRENASG